MIDLFVIDYEFGVCRIDLLGSFEIFSRSIIVFECFVGKRSAKVSMSIFRLHLYDFVVIVEGFQVILHKEVTLSAFMNITWFVLL